MTDLAAAPALLFTSIESKRKFDLANVDRKTVLMLVSQESSGSIDPVIAEIRKAYADVSEVQIANVVDLRKTPRVLRKVAETLMSHRYKESAKNLPPGRDAAEWIIILPDWQGKLIRALGIDDVSQEMAVAVVAPGGQLLGVHHGVGAAAAAIEMLTRA
ncbi:MAG: hypothetical protein ABI782_01090 [Anaerolineaceae bacterium]